MLDIKIVGGTIVDGSGAPGYRGDIGIKNGRIAAIGDLDEEAAETIDATGKVVSPGFIDVHTHYDAQAFWDPTFSPSCYHGVTTIFGGFCGFSIAPLSQEAAPYLLRMLSRVEGMPVETLEAGVPWDWSSFADYLGKLEGKIGLNAGFFVGHSAVRRVVMGPSAVGSKATPDQIAEMKRLVDKSISEGAMGFSTTVSVSHNDADGNPVPSRHASREEILELASVVGDHPGTSLEILPNTDFSNDMIELVTDYSLAGKRAVNWNVLTVDDGGKGEHERIERLLNVGTYARQKGGEVVALTLPSPIALRINFYSGFVFDSLPGWAPFFKLPPEQRIEKLHDPFVRITMKLAAESRIGLSFGMFADWENYHILEVHSAKNKDAEGRRVGDIAAERGVDPFDLMMDIIIEDKLMTSFQPKVTGDDPATYELRKKLWQDDRVIIGASDAGAHMDMIDTFAFSTKLLERARQYDLLSTEEAVHLMTKSLADYLGLKERGLLQEGYHADITVFDPTTVACEPVYTRYDLPGTKEHGRLYAEATGIACVIVNGKVLVRDNVITDERSGAVLRSGQDTETVAIPRGNPAI